MSAKKKVLITVTNYFLYCAEAKMLLLDNGVELIANHRDRAFLYFGELQEVMGDVDAVVAGLDDWNEKVFAISPKLKTLSRFGVGVDNIDLAQARKYGIDVTNAPGINSVSVAELTVGMMIDVLRKISGLNQLTKKGIWERFVGLSVRGKTIGLLGFGNIAQNVAKLLTGFGVTVLAYDKYPNLEAAGNYNVTMTSAEEILSRSDVVSVHIPNIAETRGFMNAARIGAMKDGAVLINTARGPLVDEKALFDALKSGKLSGAALDVYETEPVAKDNPLLGLPNLITTPHTAGETRETYRDVGLLGAQAILDVFAGKKPKNLVN